MKKIIKKYPFLDLFFCFPAFICQTATHRVARPLESRLLRRHLQIQNLQSITEII